jgi:hypothetical protein
MLKKFRMKYCAPVNIPMVTSYKLRKDDESLEENQTFYRSMIGSIIYLTTSRLNIMKQLVLVAQFQAAPK